MSTIDEKLPIRISPRPLRFGDSPSDPAEILRTELSRVARETDALLSDIAVHWFQMHRLARDMAVSSDSDEALSEGLTILSENLKDVLDDHAVEARDMKGQAFDSQAKPLVEVRASSFSESIEKPTIVHTERPAVLRHGRLILKAVVLVESPQRNAGE